jgi:thiamine pyrophosphokinase
MSSHHFVREGQEPALLIMSEVTSQHGIGPLLEWAPHVVVLQNAIDSVLLYGIKTDTVIASTMDLQILQDKVSHQMPVSIIKASSSEEELEVAMNSLINNRQFAVNIWSTHPDSIFSLLISFIQRMNISVIDGELKWSAISGQFRKWFPAQAKIHFLAQDSYNKLEGDVLQNENEWIAKKDGFITIESEKPFWIGQSIK